MLGENITSESWPACGEIDIMEMVGHESGTVHGTLHYGNPHKYSGKSYSLPGGKTFSDDFHIFAIEWEKGEIRWYVDDVLYSIQNNRRSSLNPWPTSFDKPFFIILNVAVGGRWPGSPSGDTTFSQRMCIDYVRVYQ